MALDRRGKGRRNRPGRAKAKEERSLFPVWALLVIASCALVWFYGAKLYQQQMAAYESYAAISRVAVQTGYFPGVTVDGVDLGGMSREDAAALFEGKKQQAASEFSLVVAAGEKRWLITSSEVPMTFNADQVLERAYAVGRMGTLEERWAQIEKARDEGVYFTTGYTFDYDAVSGLVAIIGDALDVEAKDATLDAFDVNERTFTFTDASAGYRIDRQGLQADILSALESGAYDQVILVRGEAIAPAVTRAQLEGLFGKVSSYTTQTTKDNDRNTNIALSAGALNGRVVMPGETLSFNNCTGQRTGEKGYREAGAIAGGVLVDDTGGGVCQTSSTLFNAVIRADMEIVERYAHSWPSSYVEKGEDATVNWPSLDFVFRNSSDFPVFIVAWYENRAVTVEVYGHKLPDGEQIELYSEVTKTLEPDNDILYTRDESLPKGSQKAGRKKRTGYVVDTYKIYQDAQGNELRREKLWTTTYRESQEEILFN